MITDSGVPATRPRQRRTWIDWPKAARLIVEGNHPETVAAELGIGEERVWRHLETSARFRELIRQARAQSLLLAAVADSARQA